MLGPAIDAIIPDPPPRPGNPFGEAYVQGENERLQGRGDGSERPENEGDLTPDHGPDRRDLAPIVAPYARDEGGDAATEVAELEAELDEVASLATTPGLVGSEGETAEFRSIGSLPAEWSPEDLASAEAHGIDPWPD